MNKKTSHSVFVRLFDTNTNYSPGLVVDELEYF